MVPVPAELQLKKLFEDRESLQGQVSLLKSQLNQRERDGTDKVQNPEGDSLENGMNSHVLDLQSEYPSSPVLSSFGLSDMSSALQLGLLPSVASSAVFIQINVNIRAAVEVKPNWVKVLNKASLTC